jgi:hypothetical protein
LEDIVRTILLISCLLPAAVSCVTAQSSVRAVGHREQAGACKTCTMIAEPLGIAGNHDDAELIGDEASVALLPDQRLLVGNAGGGLILVYSPAGK